MKKWIVLMVSALMGAIVGISIVDNKAKIEMNKFQKTSDKHFSLFLMMNQWVRIKQEGKNLSAYLRDKGYKNIAVYGMSYAGETLVDELKNSDVHVLYGIDGNAGGIHADINIVSINEELAPVDAILVTAVTFFDDIREKLLLKVKCPVISLEDILYEI